MSHDSVGNLDRHRVTRCRPTLCAAGRGLSESVDGIGFVVETRRRACGRRGKPLRERRIHVMTTDDLSALTEALARVGFGATDRITIEQALAPLIAEREAKAWEEGLRAGVDWPGEFPLPVNPYRSVSVVRRMRAVSGEPMGTGKSVGFGDAGASVVGGEPNG